jgi:general secretion pathway protein I
MSGASIQLRRPMRGARARGFGLLEAIVALTLLATAGTVLFGWLNQNLETLTRLREHDERARLRLNAQALAATIDPLQQPQGSLDAAGMHLTWRSTPRQPIATRGIIEVGNDQQWRIGLFELQVTAENQRRPAQAVSFTMLQLGMQPPAGFAGQDGKP